MDKNPLIVELEAKARVERYRLEAQIWHMLPRQPLRCYIAQQLIWLARHIDHSLTYPEPSNHHRSAQASKY